MNEKRQSHFDNKEFIKHRVEFNRRKADRLAKLKAEEERPMPKEKAKTPEESASERASAKKRFTEAYESFHRKNTEKTHRDHHASISECSRAGVSLVEMTQITKEIQLKVAREKLADAVETFRKDPSGEQEIADLQFARNQFVALGGTAEDASAIVKKGMKG